MADAAFLGEYAYLAALILGFLGLAFLRRMLAAPAITAEKWWVTNPSEGEDDPQGRLRLGVPLPDELAAYKQTALFTPDNCPRGLISRHNTKTGTWGVVKCTKGAVRYRVLSGGDAGSAIVIPEGEWFWVGPQIFHQVVFLSRDSAFYVVFYGASNETVDPPKFIEQMYLEEL